MEINEITLSSLPKTWIFDLDGTLLRHNGHLSEKGDELLPGTKEFVDEIDEHDKVIILTSRGKEYSDTTKSFLHDNKIRYDEIIFDVPVGERILINDKKPSGLSTAIAINKNRDEPNNYKIIIDSTL